jgi:hypothetical protein
MPLPFWTNDRPQQERGHDIRDEVMPYHSVTVS